MRSNKGSVRSRAVRVGFVPLTDCAPLVVAQELGLFKKFGVHVALQRELGWATVRDKILHGELDAAHALVAMPLAATLGLGSLPCDCLTALVLNLHGNGITFSNELIKCGVTSGAALRAEITQRRVEKTFTFGVVAPFSSHRHLLRKWLASAGINPDTDVRIVVVPPPQMVANLKAGHLDGFCVGEPWNTVAEAAGAGKCVATSSELDPGHPEKVLMVRRDFAEQRTAEHLALIAALLEACEWCANPANHKQLAATLARPEFVGVPPEVLRRGLAEFCLFHDASANEPSGDKAAWAIELVRASGLLSPDTQLSFALGRQVFRPDIFEQAARLSTSTSTQNDYEPKHETVLV